MSVIQMISEGHVWKYAAAGRCLYVCMRVCGGWRASAREKRDQLRKLSLQE